MHVTGFLFSFSFVWQIGAAVLLFLYRVRTWSLPNGGWHRVAFTRYLSRYCIYIVL